MLTLNQACQATFKTPSGVIATNVGMTKDLSVPPRWIGRKEVYAWVALVRIGENLIDIKFDINQQFVGVKYCHEDDNKYRRVL